MFLDHLTHWATTHIWPVAAVLAAVLATVWIIVRRVGGPILTAGVAALVATAFSADTSWRFAGHWLGMESGERLALFAAGEVALLACAIMARANKRATAADTTAGTPGVPGILVWCITGIQIIPAFAESGFWGGLFRAAFGPVMAALLWHLAMGLEIRITRPGALSTGLPAQIGHELRERLLSYLGLATRNRTAEQISRDRATTRAVRLASRNHLGWWGRAALKAAVDRSGAATDPAARERLLQQLAGRRTAAELRTLPVPTPWALEPPPEPAPAHRREESTPAPQPPAEYTANLERAPVPAPPPPVPEVYPALAEPVPVVPAVPRAVPPGVKLLPIVASPGDAEPTPADTDGPSRTGPEVHAEYVPEPYPDPVPDRATDGYGDPLSEYGFGLAAEHFEAELLAGETPSIRAIKARLSVGQPRAQEIQDRFRKAQAARRLAGAGVAS
ncbi:hypothetical protein [Streptomyces sp. LNU-CPARS28]|uniref:hypothetical protein n=1 Tax=Streptomyces sp. LNU-CPARS28 TaxID=3137371 RepID=UPI003135528E